MKFSNTAICTGIKESKGEIEGKAFSSTTFIEMAHQLFEDNVDFDHGAVLVDLDRIGTANDYV